METMSRLQWYCSRLADTISTFAVVGECVCVCLFVSVCDAKWVETAMLSGGEISSANKRGRVEVEATLLGKQKGQRQSGPVRTRWSMGGVACAVLWVVNGIQKRTVTMIV